jgi:GNAT superfamily N-acetyltransferase
MFTIRVVAAEQTRPLRHKILRPHLPFETTAYPNDYDNDALHVGAFVEDELVGVATVFRAPMPVEQDDILHNASWQLRGMAVKEEMRGKGFGAALVRACVQHIAQHDGSVL